MSDYRRTGRLSGRLITSPITDFWQIARDAQDPSIPNLPLETPAASGPITATASITEATDSASSEATLRLLASFESPEIDDTVAAQSAVLVLAGTAVVEASDSLSASIELENLPITAGAEIAEAADTVNGALFLVGNDQPAQQSGGALPVRRKLYPPLIIKPTVRRPVLAELYLQEDSDGLKAQCALGASPAMLRKQRAARAALLS